MAIPFWPIIAGAAASIFGGSQAANAAGAANRQLGRVVDYGFKRRAQLDPLFTEFLSRAAMRGRMAPRFGGVRGRAYLPLTTPQKRLPALPPPRLIGED